MADEPLRETDYAVELVPPARIQFPSGGEGRIERLRFKKPDDGREGYRFSWWKDGKMMIRPFDATEEEFLELFQRAVDEGVFTPECMERMRAMLNRPA